MRQIIKLPFYWFGRSMNTVFIFWFCLLSSVNRYPLLLLILKNNIICSAIYEQLKSTPKFYWTIQKAECLLHIICTNIAWFIFEHTFILNVSHPYLSWHWCSNLFWLLKHVQYVNVWMHSCDSCILSLMVDVFLFQCNRKFVLSPIAATWQSCDFLLVTENCC